MKDQTLKMLIQLKVINTNSLQMNDQTNCRIATIMIFFPINSLYFFYMYNNIENIDAESKI